MTKILLLGAVAAAALGTTQSFGGTVFSPADLSNRAVAASPRAKEEFPWLARQASPAHFMSSTPRAEVGSKIKANRAFATSPRVLEQFPELARTRVTQTVATSASQVGSTEFDRVIKNTALAASPRIKEKFPALSRGYTPQTADKSYETAPLK